MLSCVLNTFVSFPGAVAAVGAVPRAARGRHDEGGVDLSGLSAWGAWSVFFLLIVPPGLKCRQMGALWQTCARALLYESCVKLWGLLAAKDRQGRRAGCAQRYARV